MPVAECAPWTDQPPSTLSHHGAQCCDQARAWFHAMNRSMWRGTGGPAWIAQRFPWGPSRWPLFWCEAMAADELDCGAHAVLSAEAFRARGAERVVPAQLVLRQERHFLPHWEDRWTEGGASTRWAGDGAAYHEACATIRDGKVEVWDASANSWVLPDRTEGLYSVAAIRIGGVEVTGEQASWHGVPVPLGSWVSPADQAAIAGD